MCVYHLVTEGLFVSCTNLFSKEVVFRALIYYVFCLTTGS